MFLFLSYTLMYDRVERSLQEGAYHAGRLGGGGSWGVSGSGPMHAVFLLETAGGGSSRIPQVSNDGSDGR